MHPRTLCYVHEHARALTEGLATVRYLRAIPVRPSGEIHEVLLEGRDDRHSYLNAGDFVECGPFWTATKEATDATR